MILCLVNHHITGHLVSVLVSTERVMMCPVTDNPAGSKICAATRFLPVSMSAAKIHHELCAVYGRNVMSEGAVRQWCRMFRDGQTNVCNVEQSGQPFVVSDDYVQSVITVRLLHR
jgi:hypothetical protein